MNLDAYMDDFGRGLTRAARTRRRRRTGRRLALLVPVAAAATVAAIVAPGPSGGTVDAIAAARAALAPRRRDRPHEARAAAREPLVSAGRAVVRRRTGALAHPHRWGPAAVRGTEMLFRNGRVRLYDAAARPS